MIVLILLTLLIAIAGFFLTKNVIKNTSVRFLVWLSAFLIAAAAILYYVLDSITNFYSTRSGSETVSDKTVK